MLAAISLTARARTANSPRNSRWVGRFIHSSRRAPLPTQPGPAPCWWDPWHLAMAAIQICPVQPEPA